MSPPICYLPFWGWFELWTQYPGSVVPLAMFVVEIQQIMLNSLSRHFSDHFHFHPTFALIPKIILALRVRTCHFVIFALVPFPLMGAPPPDSPDAKDSSHQPRVLNPTHQGWSRNGPHHPSLGNHRSRKLLRCESNTAGKKCPRGSPLRSCSICPELLTWAYQ